MLNSTDKNYELIESNNRKIAVVKTMIGKNDLLNTHIRGCLLKIGLIEYETLSNSLSIENA